MGGGVEWHGMRWVGVRGCKNPSLGHPMSNNDTQTLANDTPVDHRFSGMKARSPPPYWHPPFVPL